MGEKKCRVCVLILMLASVSMESADSFGARVSSGDSGLYPGYVIYITGEITGPIRERVTSEKGEYDGAIEFYLPGDYEQVIDIVRARGGFPGSVILRSPGGEVREAMKLGKLLQRAMVPVYAIEECHSACFLVWLGGKPRDQIDATFGLHRPFFDRNYFSSLSAGEANKMYREVERVAEAYMEEMGVSSRLIDEMMSTKSTDVQPISGPNMVADVGRYPAAYEEWLIANCGEFSKGEQKDWEVLMVFALATALEESASDALGRSGRGEELTDEDQEIVTAFVQSKMKTLGLKALPAGYEAYLREKSAEIGACHSALRVEQRASFMQEIFASQE